MLRKVYRIAFAALLTLSATANAASVPVRLDATSNWVLDYADERCSLLRNFGPVGSGVTLRLDSHGSPRDYRALLSGPAVPRILKGQSEIRFRLTPDSEDRKVYAITGTVGSHAAVSFSLEFAPYEPDPKGLSARQAALHNAVVQPPDIAFEKLISAMTMNFGSGKPVELVLGSMEQPLAAMRNCLGDLVQTWGLDPAVQMQLTRKPAINPNTVRAIQRDYPVSMLIAETSAYLPVRVMVDAGGMATACVIQSEGAPEPFRKSVCDGLMGTYQPALDAAGHPVASVYHTSVVYLLMR